MDKSTENDALWELLGRARRTEASPWFARKVMRAIAEEKQPRFSMAVLFRWLIPASALAAVVLGFSVYHSQQDAAVAEFNEYFDSAAELPSLVAQESASLWVDAN